MTLRRNDLAKTLALSDLHAFNSNLTNEARLGVFLLNNSRSLDDPFPS